MLNLVQIWPNIKVKVRGQVCWKSFRLLWYWYLLTASLFPFRCLVLMAHCFMFCARSSQSNPTLICSKEWWASVTIFTVTEYFKPFCFDLWDLSNYPTLKIKNFTFLVVIIIFPDLVFLSSVCLFIDCSVWKPCSRWFSVHCLSWGATCRTL